METLDIIWTSFGIWTSIWTSIMKSMDINYGHQLLTLRSLDHWIIWTSFGHPLDIIWNYGHQLSTLRSLRSLNWTSFGHHLDFIWNLDINLDINNEVLDHKLWTSIINIENCKTMEQHYCNTGELRNGNFASSSSSSSYPSVYRKDC